MAKTTKILRGIGMVSAVALAGSVTCGAIMEMYPTSLDTFFGTLSSTVVTEQSTESDWVYKSQFKTAKEAVDGMREFSIRAAAETMTLLKNKNNNALPLTKGTSVTLLGLRSYAMYYGNTGGSIPDTKTVEANKFHEVMAGEEAGFKVNPTMVEVYKNYCADKTWAYGTFGNSTPSYKELDSTDTIHELSPTELAALNANYKDSYGDYNEAAIVVVGRAGGENVAYTPGEQDTTTGNILGLSAEEKAIIQEAKDNFDKVIVLVNSTNAMELGELERDDGIDAVLWIGYPGAYGAHAVAQVLNGTVSPSGHLGDVYAANSAVNPAMRNFGAETPWADIDEALTSANVNTYLVEAEGIYTGYRYYETRYADVVDGVAGAATAKAGTYVNADGTAATTDGTWNYNYEVVYPFGHGLSYTDFTQTLDEVTVSADKKTATVKVTVTNIGDKAGKSVVQLYAQTPYTAYDKNAEHPVEKSAIQLIDFEKTAELTTDGAGKTQTITMNVDLSNLASYDAYGKGTYIVEGGDVYFAIGDNAHDALNNIFAKQGKTPDNTDNRMTAAGDESKVKVQSDLFGEENTVDDTLFSTSKNGTKIENAVTEGESAMDFNYFKPNTVTYLSRSNWDGTYPKKYEGLSACTTEELYKLLSNNFYTLKTNDDTSDIVWGKDNGITLYDMKGASFDDPRWAKVLEQVTIEEFLDFASHAFHAIYEIPSVNYVGDNADDGPNGSDSHYLNEGKYQGTPFADAADYERIGTRVGPSATNLAYAFNKELAFENGEIILGESTLMLELPIMIGPGMNLHRHAYNGRGGEYYSEDPILSGYIGSAVVQGAQSKGTLVNIKHAAFNDQEINRSGIAVFMNEQKAREMELRNLQQAFEGNGKPAAFVGDATKDGTYVEGARGVMSSYNRIGATAPSANKGVMVQIMRNEWGFKGYNVTDFTGVSLRAAPKESILYGTTAFCGFGVQGINYWSENALKGDRDICLAIKDNMHYVLYSLANSAAVNGGYKHRVQLMSKWRKIYVALESVFGVTTAGLIAAYIVLEVLDARKKKEGK